MYDFHKIRLKDKSKEFRHRYFKKDQKDLLKFIKRKTPDQNNFDENAQKSIDAMISAFNDLQIKYNMLKEEKERGYSQLESLLVNSGDSETKLGMDQLVKLLSKSLNQGESSLSNSDASKLSMTKKLFENFARIDRSLVEEAQTTPSLNNYSQCSTHEGSPEDSDTILGKRSFQEACLSEPIIDFLPSKKYSAFCINNVEESFLSAKEAEFSIEPNDQTNSFFNFL